MGDGSLVTLANSWVRDNEASFSCGGLWLGVGATLDGLGTGEVSNNTADLTGGGVCADPDVSLANVAITFNQAISGGGVDGSDLTLTDVSLEYNTGTVSAGAMFLSGNNLLVRTTILGNEGTVDVGGMTVTGQGSVADLVDCVVTDNYGGSMLSEVGGVELFGASLVSTNTDWGMGANANDPTDRGAGDLVDPLRCGRRADLHLRRRDRGSACDLPVELRPRGGLPLICGPRR